MEEILISGSTGFVGKYLVKDFSKKEYSYNTISLRTDEINRKSYKNISTIIHLAGLAHQMKKIDSQNYFDVNHLQTMNFAKSAKTNGVKHFIFISTIKVYGDRTNEILDEDSDCLPSDPYGHSKFAAENDLMKLADDNFVISIIRPPLIYGHGVKGNLEKLIKLIHKLPFLPFGGIKNERSMVYVGNLVALIEKIIVLKMPGIFIAGDQSRSSTTLLVDTMIKHMGLQKANVSLPFFIINLLSFLKPALYTRLFDSYIIDNSKTNLKLKFIPPFSFDEGIKSMVEGFKKEI